MTSGKTAAVLLIAATILAYANAFNTVFQFDDRATILQDPRLAGVSAFAADAGQMIRPVVKLSFLVDRQLYGQDPAGYHLVNLLLHCGSGLLLFAILRRAGTPDRGWYNRWVAKNATHPSTRVVTSCPVPFFTTLLFLLHPIETETVTYISGRPTGMAAFFCLLSLYLYIRATEDLLPGRRFAVCYYGALLSFIVALLSKETAVILPILLLLWQAVIHPAGLRTRALYLHAPFWAILGLGLIAVGFHPRYSFLAQASLETRSLYSNLLTQIHAVCHALTLFLLPARLNFDHDLPVFSSVSQWPVPACLALLAGIMGIAVWSMRRHRLLAFGILWFFVCLLPANSVIPRYDILSERNLYLPSIGVFVVSAWLLGALISKAASIRPAIAPVLLSVICIFTAAVLLINTMNRNSVYADQVAFWSDASQKSPDKARTHNNLGYALYRAGKVDRALEEFRIALSLDPQSTSARENLLRVWRIKHGGDFE